jgi:ABC-type antimicrobial peptide transport system permease subunit
MAPAGPALYVPVLQMPRNSGYYFLRARGDSGALAAAARAALAEIDAEVPIYGVRTMADVARDATARPRFAAQLLGGFAVVALLLAALGVYGVMAQSVAQRRREIGIRIALGARGRQVMWLLVRQGAAIAVAGVAAGLVLAFLASRVLSGLLYGVSVTDAATYAAVAALLFAVAVAACLAAARRAVSVDPAETLREG